MNHYVFSIDSELRIISWDKALESLTGKDFFAVKGIPYHDVFPKICNGNADAVLEALQDGKPRVLQRNRNICLYGANETDISIQPIRDDAENLIGATVTIEPYSSCKIWEKFQQSQPLIDIGKIASTLAHGVRNPLNAIKGAVVYIKERYKNDPTLKEFTNIMESEITRLDVFISKFLSTSVLDSGRSESNICSVLKKIEIFTSLQAKAQNINTTYEYGNVPSVVINSFQLEQAILNVINNAIEAMHSKGNLKVRTYAEKRSDSGFVVVEVSDTGPGMPESKKSKDSMPLGGKGRGFGLFITREMLQSHGGFMEIKSEKGRGTVVKLYLPSYSIKE